MWGENRVSGYQECALVILAFDTFLHFDRCLNNSCAFEFVDVGVFELVKNAHNAKLQYLKIKRPGDRFLNFRK